MASSMLRSLRGLAAEYVPQSVQKYQLIVHTRSTSDPLSPPSSSPSSSIILDKPEISTYDSNHHTATLAFHHFVHSVRRFLFLLLPSFIQRKLRPSQFKPHKIHPTSYLDGLRGLASLFVFFCHFTEAKLPWFSAHPYGSRDEKDLVKESSFLQLPFFRVMYSGRPMVHIFFFISGFVLCLKPIRLIRKRDFTGVLTTLSSSVFRRAMRLFLPATVVSFVTMTFVHQGYSNPEWRSETWAGQIKDWIRALFHEITNSWRWDDQTYPKYDIHLWTIPIEFANSMVLFVTVLGLARVKTWVRLVTVVGIMVYSVKMGHWATFEFIGGVLVGEISWIRAAWAERAASLPSSKEEAEPRSTFSSKLTAVLYTPFWTANFVLALWIVSWPNNNVNAVPLLGYLQDSTPSPMAENGRSNFFWFGVAALQIMLSLQSLPFLQRFFTTPPIYYLGNISYALYIVHGPVMHMLCHKTQKAVWAVVGHSDNGTATRNAAWVLGLATIAVPVIWTADLVWRAVDIPSVDFARWVENKCLIKEE